MSALISVIEWNTGQSFHSKNLAASYFNIPYSLVTKSIKKGEEVITKRGKKLRFTTGGSTRSRSVVHKPKSNDGKTLNFGKHKGVQMRDIPTQYLKWAYDNVSRCPKCVGSELIKRNESLNR